MKEKIMNLKSSYILYSIIALIIAALMFGVSTAKYTDKVTAYSNFGVANFNAIILGDSSSGTVKAFDESIIADNCEPGMEYNENIDKNTAKIIPFSIANGINSSNASEAGISYTIKLRTTRNIPLDFSLLNTVSETVEDESNPGSTKTVTKTVIYKSGDPVLVENSNSGDITRNIWYEWTFYEVENEPGSGEDENVGGDGDTKAEENGSQSEKEETKKEVVFSLDGGDLSINNYKLIVEWPITESGAIKVPDGSEGTIGIEDNSTIYMKEIDLIELFVTVSSKNTLDEETKEIEYDLGDLYGKGIILIDPNKGIVEGNDDYTNQYAHLIDLRAFHEVDFNKYKDNSSADNSGNEVNNENSNGNNTGANLKAKAYEFEINNGVGMGIKPKSNETEYYFELKVPYTAELDDAYPTYDFEYSLYKLNVEKEYERLEKDETIEYRLYDVQYNSETYGKYKIIENIQNAEEAGWEPEFADSDVEFENLVTDSEDESFDIIKEWTEEKSQYRLYKIYSYKDSIQSMRNKEETSGNTFIDRTVTTDYCLVIDNWPVSYNENSDKFGNMVFENKLEIVVNANMANGGGN